MPLCRVSVGILVKDNQVLVARRHAHQHQGGLWEFPGGKIELSETPLEALTRELREEIAIEVLSAEFLFTVQHVYPDKQVQLEIFRVLKFEGTPEHQEGQVLEWKSVAALAAEDLPEANYQILDYLISQSATR